MSRTYRHSKTHTEYFRPLTEKGHEEMAPRGYYKLFTDNMYPFFRSEMSKEDRSRYHRKVRAVARLHILREDEIFISPAVDMTFVFN